MIVGRSLTGCLAYSLRPDLAEATVAADGKNALAASTRASACVGSFTAMQQIADWLEKLKRALMLCQPFTMLRPEHYDLWKDIEIKFNNELLGG